MSDNFKDKETLLKVEHLCQYFKLGQSTLKAVNDVSFDIKKGEVFGLVGESGCGKTTTGRSIIKLYNCTSGNVYFEGQRICAGTLSYKHEISNAFRKLLRDIKVAMRAVCKKSKTDKAEENNAEGTENALNSVDIAEDKTLRAEVEQNDGNKAQNNHVLSDSFKEFFSVVKVQLKNIMSAKSDQKRCDKKYQKQNVAKVKSEYLPRLKALEGNKQSEGYITLNGEYHKELRCAKKERLVTKIQMVFQDPIASLDPRMTVREIIAEGLMIRGIRNKKEIDEKVYEVLEKVGLVREHAGRYPHEFSGGQRQRIGVARAIIMQPELIIADEPISALDVSIQAQVINLLNDLRHELGLTILFIAHDLSVVKYFSDRIAVMYFGNMVELATSEELFAHPFHPYTKSLLSAIPLPDPIYEKKRTRIVYNPLADHDYREDKPSLREVSPGHFVSCNNEEFARYQAILKADGVNLDVDAQSSADKEEATIAQENQEKHNDAVEEVVIPSPVVADDKAALYMEPGTPIGSEPVVEEGKDN